MTDTLRQSCLRRWESLKKERASWYSHWQELSDQFQPRRGRFLGGEKNKPRRNDKIINGTPRRSVRIASAGWMAGSSNPGRPWFRVTTTDPALAEVGSVREWLYLVEERIRTVFARSNIYTGLYNVYTDLVTFGTSALYIEADDQDVIRAYPIPIGQYALAASPRQQIDTIYRQFGMTAGQLVKKFGRDQCSHRVRGLYDRGQLDEWVDVIHAVEPNPDHEPGVIGTRGKAWRSVWMERDGAADEGVLREAGYDMFPVLAPRWEVTGEDVYGSNCPGMDARGDAKGLQWLEESKALAFEQIVDPPMMGPPSLMGKGVGLLPGSFTVVDAASAGAKVEPAVVVQPQTLREFREAIAEHAFRIEQTFGVDLWLAMSGGDDVQKTAREVSARYEEKMMQLGPATERQQDELHAPLIELTFHYLLGTPGALPPAPEEMQGQDLKIEFISIMAQANKLLGVTGIERFGAFVAQAAAQRPEVLDKLNVDEMVDTMADALGVPPKLVNPDDVVAQIREQRAAQQQAQQQGEAMLQAAQGAKTLADANMDGDTALNRLLGAVGAAPPAAGVR